MRAAGRVLTAIAIHANNDAPACVCTRAAAPARAMPVGAFDAALTNNDATSVPLSDIPETFPRILAATDTHCRDCSRELPALRKSDLSFERTLVLRDGSQSTIQVWTRGKCTHCGLGHQPTYWNREEEERPVAVNRRETPVRSNLTTSVDASCARGA